jgi:hypothetical protein
MSRVTFMRGALPTRPTLVITAHHLPTADDLLRYSIDAVVLLAMNKPQRTESWLVTVELDKRELADDIAAFVK